MAAHAVSGVGGLRRVAAPNLLALHMPTMAAMDTSSTTLDPVLAQRRRIARLVGIAKRVGYLALLVAIVAFFVGLIVGFAPVIAAIATAGLITACVILPIPIVLGYGIRAANRADRALQAQQAERPDNG